MNPEWIKEFTTILIGLSAPPIVCWVFLVRARRQQRAWDDYGIDLEGHEKAKTKVIALWITFSLWFSYAVLLAVSQGIETESVVSPAMAAILYPIISIIWIPITYGVCFMVTSLSIWVGRGVTQILTNRGSEQREAAPPER